MLHAYQIETLIPHGEGKATCTQHIVAESFQQVLDHLKADIIDERTEVLSIIRYGPVIRVYQTPVGVAE